MRMRQPAKVQMYEYYNPEKGGSISVQPLASMEEGDPIRGQGPSNLGGGDNGGSGGTTTAPPPEPSPAPTPSDSSNARGRHGAKYQVLSFAILGF